MKTYETYIFDLDGTITDTAVVWLDIFRDCLELCDVPVPDVRVLAAHTHGFRQMLEIGLPESKLDMFTRQACEFADERLPHTQLHKGAYGTLETLYNQGKRMAIFSAMEKTMIQSVIKNHELDTMMAVAIGHGDVPRGKPHPDGILKALSHLGIQEAEYSTVVYVGDKDTDIQAANNAGIDSVLFFPVAHQLIYDLKEVKTHNPTHIITDWSELLPSTPDSAEQASAYTQLKST